MVFPGNCLKRPCRFLPSVSPILTSAHSASSARADSGVQGQSTAEFLAPLPAKSEKELLGHGGWILTHKMCSPCQPVGHMSLDFFEALWEERLCLGLGGWALFLLIQTSGPGRGLRFFFIGIDRLLLSSLHLLRWLPHPQGSFLSTSPA